MNKAISGGRTKTEKRHLKVSEARPLLEEGESERLINQDTVSFCLSSSASGCTVSVSWQLLSLICSTNTIQLMQLCRCTNLDSVMHHLQHVQSRLSSVFSAPPTRRAKNMCQIHPFTGVCACIVSDSMTLCTTGTACRNCVVNLSMHRCLCMRCLIRGDIIPCTACPVCLMHQCVGVHPCHASGLMLLSSIVTAPVLLSNSFSDFAEEYRHTSAEHWV